VVRISKSSLLLVLLLVLGLAAEAWAQEPAIVLTAFGTTSAAADTYRHIEGKVKERFPGQEIRWAFTSPKVRRKVAREQGKELKDLSKVPGSRQGMARGPAGKPAGIGLEGGFRPTAVERRRG
jgi:hypothetical protein